MKSTLAILMLATSALAAPASSNNGGVRQCEPASYLCTPDLGGWMVCDSAAEWAHGGNCAASDRCHILPSSLTPYCLPAHATNIPAMSLANFTSPATVTYGAMGGSAEMRLRIRGPAGRWEGPKMGPVVHQNPPPAIAHDH